MSAVLAARPLLVAATPAEFLATHLEQHAAVHEGGVDTSGHAWVGETEVLGEDAAFLRAAHRRILDTDGGTPQMAAKWLVGWAAGTVADAVGFVLGTGGAGVLVDTAPLRWRLHPGGWVDRVRLDGCTVVVPPGHPWAGQPGVEVVADEAELVVRTVDALVRAVRPVVDAVRGIGRVGARSLWAEVADAIALSPTYQPHLPVRDDVVERLRTAVTAPGAPWRVSPSVRTATAPWGPVYLGQKAGCCLAYQRPEPEPTPDADLTDAMREYYALFPPETGAARVCTTCSLRDPQGCADRQMWWLGQQVSAAVPAAPTDEG
ncbi:hypothetical protein [Aquipuribacter hungaricus]|uniref:Uncharacterized protein n=1 Tax=Aquipuribacter hungaricus TaxID=545624 RepID=A0ABV7WCZ7_9MICO